MKDVPGKSSEFQKTVRGLYQLMSFAGIEGTGALLASIVFPLKMPKIFRLRAIFRYFFCEKVASQYPGGFGAFLTTKLPIHKVFDLVSSCLRVFVVRFLLCSMASRFAEQLLNLSLRVKPQRVGRCSNGKKRPIIQTNDARWHTPREKDTTAKALPEIGE